jgi:hypothetical protein
MSKTLNTLSQLQNTLYSLYQLVLRLRIYLLTEVQRRIWSAMKARPALLIIPAGVPSVPTQLLCFIRCTLSIEEHIVQKLAAEAAYFIVKLLQA